MGHGKSLGSFDEPLIFLYVHGWASKQKPIHVYFKKIKVLIIKVKKLSKLSNANDAIEASTLFIQQEVVESQQIQPTGEQLSIVIGDECVGLAWWNYVCQYSAGVYLQCSYLQVFL
jgi:hypothetical protein